MVPLLLTIIIMILLAEWFPSIFTIFGILVASVFVLWFAYAAYLYWFDG